MGLESIECRIARLAEELNKKIDDNEMLCEVICAIFIELKKEGMDKNILENATLKDGTTVGDALTRNERSH